MENQIYYEGYRAKKGTNLVRYKRESTKQFTLSENINTQKDLEEAVRPMIENYQRERMNKIFDLMQDKSYVSILPDYCKFLKVENTDYRIFSIDKFNVIKLENKIGQTVSVSDIMLDI